MGGQAIFSFKKGRSEGKSEKRQEILRYEQLVVFNITSLCCCGQDLGIQKQGHDILINSRQTASCVRLYMVLNPYISNTFSPPQKINI